MPSVLPERLRWHHEYFRWLNQAFLCFREVSGKSVLCAQCSCVIVCVFVGGETEYKVVCSRFTNVCVCVLVYLEAILKE